MLLFGWVRSLGKLSNQKPRPPVKFQTATLWLRLRGIIIAWPAPLAVLSLLHGEINMSFQDAGVENCHFAPPQKPQLRWN